MLSARFIPEAVFYTQSVVRSPCFILTGHHTTLEKRLFSQRENMAILLTNSAALELFSHKLSELRSPRYLNWWMEGLLHCGWLTMNQGFPT